MIKKIISHPLFSGSLIMIGGSTIASALGYLYHLVMGRMLGPVNYGSLASIFAILQVVSIVPISSSFAIVKFVADAKNEEERTAVYESIKKFIWIIAVVSLIILLLLTPVMTNFLHVSDYLAVAFVGPIMFFSLIILIDQSAMQGILKFVGVALPGLSSAFFKLVLGVVFVVFGFSVNGAVGGMLAGLIITYVITLWLKGNLFSKKTKKQFDIKRFLKYAFPVLIMALAFTSMFTVDVVLVKHFLPPFEAGIYAALSNLGKIIFFASQPITQTMFPIVSKRRANKEAYRKIFFAAFVSTVGISLAIVVFYWLFPNIAIGILYGEKYMAAKGELVWMGIFITIYTISYLLVNFMLSIERTKVTMFALIAAVAQVVGLSIWHNDLLQVVQVSVVCTTFLFLSSSLSLSYNEYRRIYAKTK